MYAPIAPTSETPACAASGNTVAKMPTGASQITPRTSVIIASPSARKNVTSVVRVSFELFATAIAKSSTNNTNGTIAPFAAAPTGLFGSNDVVHDAKVCTWPPLVSSRAASAAPAGSAGLAPAGSSEKSAGATSVTTIAAPNNKATKTNSDVAPMRPIPRTSAAEATPVMISATMSGITVIRIAVTHSEPIGAIASANWRA